MAKRKAQLRLWAKARRRHSNPVSLELYRRLDGLLGQIAPVAAFWPLPGEIDLRPWIEARFGAGQTVLLPEVVGRREPLRFRRFQGSRRLRRGAFGVMAPDPGSDVLKPSAILVPLLAVDPAGYRVGYGGGFYDRTLASLRKGIGAKAIGVGWPWQSLAQVPKDSRDQPLDSFVTENGVTHFPGNPRGGAG